MTQHNTERIIEEFLGGNPRATEWRALRQALEGRLISLRRQRQREAEDGAPEARLASLDAQITALDRQVATLETEEAVAQFVEDSIKYTVAQSDLEAGLEEEE
ncbi:MAG: hypothetical protein JO250_14140 [Armatimonadetes bacterium]|nr:hypothetical protein [Armatimonadota bacterium]